MSTLRDRLADLADRAPAGHPDPGLWERGRRYGRRRRVGTAVIVVVTVALLGLVVGTSELRSRTGVEPAGPTTAPALPTRIVVPSPWFPGTDDAGPLGQLAAIVPADRGDDDDAGLAAISASTGEYRFLDLPDASGSAVALAPDGRHLAYWVTGDTRLSPNGAGVVGVAVYDTSTGEVDRLEVPTDHGLEGEELVWVDSDRLVLSYLHWVGGVDDDDTAQASADDPSGLLLWSPGTGTPARSPLARFGSRVTVEFADGRGHLLLTDDDGFHWIDVDRPTQEVTDPWTGSTGTGIGTAAVDPSGSRIASPHGSSNPSSIIVRELGRPPGTAVEIPDSAGSSAVEAWIGRDHVALSRRIDRADLRFGLFHVDVQTGDAMQLLEYPRAYNGSTIQVASDLLATPSLDRPLPPDVPAPTSPWLTGGLCLLVLVAGGASYLLWRRRVRA